jgi:hypothetical protein
MAKAANLVAAMPRFAASAAMIVRFPPLPGAAGLAGSALIRAHSCRSPAGSRASSISRTGMSSRTG